MELMRFHGPNMLSCEFVSGGKRTLIVGAYPPPSTLEHLPNLEDAMDRLRDQDTIVLGYLNAEIGQDQIPLIQTVSDMLLEVGLLDLLRNLHQ